MTDWGEAILQDCAWVMGFEANGRPSPFTPGEPVVLRLLHSGVMVEGTTKTVTVDWALVKLIETIAPLRHESAGLFVEFLVAVAKQHPDSEWNVPDTTYLKFDVQGYTPMVLTAIHWTPTALHGALAGHVPPAIPVA